MEVLVKEKVWPYGGVKKKGQEVITITRIHFQRIMNIYGTKVLDRHTVTQGLTLV